MGLIMGDGAEEVVSYDATSDKDAIFLRADTSSSSPFQLSIHHYDRDTPAWQEFRYIDRAVMDAGRFYHIMNLVDPSNDARPAFEKTLNHKSFNSKLPDPYKSELLNIDGRIETAKTYGLITEASLKLLKKKPIKFGCFQTAIHSGIETDISNNLKILLFIAVKALIKVKVHLGYVSNNIFDGDSTLLHPSLVEFVAENKRDIAIRKQNDQTTGKTGQAQHAMNWLLDNLSVFVMSGHYARQAMVAVSQVCSELTNYPIENSPNVKKASQLLINDSSSSGKRLVSLWSQHFILGKHQTLYYDKFVYPIQVTEDDCLDVRGSITLDELCNHLFSAEQALGKPNEWGKWDELKKSFWKVKKAYKDDKSFIELWDHRIEELCSLMEAYLFCHDYIHRIGFMDAVSGTLSDDARLLCIGHLIHYSTSIHSWINYPKSYKGLEELSQRLTEGQAHLKTSFHIPPVVAEVIKSEKSPAEELADRRDQLVALFSETFIEKGRGATPASILHFFGRNDSFKDEKNKKASKLDVENAKKEGKVLEIGQLHTKRSRIGPRATGLIPIIEAENAKTIVTTASGKKVPKANTAYQKLLETFPPVSLKEDTDEDITYQNLRGGKVRGGSGEDVADWLIKYLPKATLQRLRQYKKRTPQKEG